MPFVVPPARLSLGAGPATGVVPRAYDELLPEVVTSFRAGFHPWDLADRPSERAFDFGAGYAADWISGEAATGPDQAARREHVSAQGPYLEGSYAPFRYPIGEGTALRLGARTDLDLLFLGTDARTGFGGSGVVEFEISHDVFGPFVSDDDDEPGVLAGVQRGRWALALFAGGSFRDFGGESYGGVTGGVSVRLPFLAGIACCAWPGHDDDADDAKRKRAHARPRSPRRKAQPRPAEPVVE